MNENTDRRLFHAAWEQCLKQKMESFCVMPKPALAYEIAWHAFKAGRASGAPVPSACPSEQSKRAGEASKAQSAPNHG